MKKTILRVTITAAVVAGLAASIVAHFMAWLFVAEKIITRDHSAGAILPLVAFGVTLAALVACGSALDWIIRAGKARRKAAIRAKK